MGWLSSESNLICVLRIKEWFDVNTFGHLIDRMHVHVAASVWISMDLWGPTMIRYYVASHR